MLANFIYVGIVAGVSFWLLGKVVKMRTTPEEELAGLDIPEMGVEGYCDDAGPTHGAPVPSANYAGVAAPSLAPSAK